MKLKGTQKKVAIVMLHIAFWLLLFSLPSILRPNHETRPRESDPVARMLFYSYLINCVTWIGLFYFNSFFLIPFFVARKQYLQYVLSLLPVLVVLVAINVTTFKLLFPHRDASAQGTVTFYLLPTLFILSISTAVSMFQNQLRIDSLNSRRENEHLKTELAFLRSQISPHFMFNVLNNMVVLARKQSDQLEPSLFKLSALLRYMLYETDEEKVLLDKEVEYLQSYIDLQLQRFGSKVTVNTRFCDFDKGICIAPMLLIPFVENAFKHGTGFKQKSMIDIELSANLKLVTFKVSNYFDESVLQVKDNTSGIGLQNVMRRLNLLYKDKHQLQIDQKDNRFVVTLQIRPE